MAEKSRNVTVHRLLIGFSSIILLLIAFGVISLIEIRTLSKITRTIYNHPLVVSNTSLRATVSMIKMHRSMKDVALFDFPTEINIAINAVNEQERMVFKSLDIVKKNILGDEGQKLENETRHLFVTWKPIREEVIKLVSKGQREKAAKITMGKGADHVAKLENKMLELTSYARNKATGFMRQGEKVHSRVMKTTIILISIGLLLSVLIAFFTIRRTQTAEKALRESEERFRDLAEGSIQGIHIHRDHKPLFVNKACAAIYGYIPEEILRMDSIVPLFSLQDQARLVKYKNNRLNGKEAPAVYEYQGVHRDGSLIWLETKVRVVQWEGQPAIQSTIFDISKRKQAEEALKKLNLELEGRVEQRTTNLRKEILEREHAEAELVKTKTKLQDVFDGISDSLIMLDNDTKIVMLNRAAAEYYHVKLKEVIGKPCYQAFKERSNPCEGCKIAPAVSNGEHVSFERDGFMDPEKFEQVIIYPIREEYDEAGSAIIRISDITEAKLMQQHLFQSGKLASVGELAAGVAHEINNPINGIINYAQILIDEAEERGDEVNIPGRILKEGERIASIIRNLLSFSRQTDDKVAPASIQTIVSDALELVGKQLRNDGIQLQLEIADDLPKSNINSQRMQQVFMNLFSNARYALNQKYHGAHKDKALQIKGELKQVDEETCVSLSVYDRGVGIPAEVIDRVCDPFFSAKPRGEGTGLGLSISYAIVKDYGGKLLFDSKEGEYTKVTVELPVSN